MASPRTSNAGRSDLTLQRQRPDGAGVFGDVFAHQSVAARDGLLHPAIPIVRGHRQSVQLQLGDIFESLAVQQVAHAPIELAQLFFVQRVVETQHGRAVAEP